MSNHSNPDNIKHITPKGDIPIPPWQILRVFRELWNHRQLAMEFAKRDLIHRYKESYLGILWSLLTPLFFLALYSFMFSVVFNSSWQPPRMVAMKSTAELIGSGPGAFAMVLFPGLLLFNCFSEILSLSIGSFINNPQYVRKMVFPLEVLPLGQCISVFLNFLIGFAVFFIAMVFYLGTIPWTLIFLVLVLLPLFILCVGIAFWIASLSVFIRDVSQIVSVFSMAMLFLSPVFYGFDRLKDLVEKYLPNSPDWVADILRLNPLTTLLENIRLITVFQNTPEWGWLLFTTIIAVIVFISGFNFFQRSKKAFADVI